MHNQDDNLSILDVRIDEPDKLPPKYFLHPHVQEALRKVVRDDVVLNKKRVPPGAAPLWGPPEGTLAGETAKLQHAWDRFIRHFWFDLPAFIVFLGVTILVMLVFIAGSIG